MKGSIMVAPSFSRLDFVPKPCYARPMLYGALDSFERGDYIAAGVKLREAMRRFLESACDWYGVEAKRKYRTPAVLAHALQKAGHLGDNLDWVLEIIDVGNKAAHCHSVNRHALKGGIAVAFAIMDREPCCPHDRTPIDTTHHSEGYDVDDCDDDDGAGWWKIGGAV